MTGGAQGRRPLVERLALHRPETRAWALYDWANSAMYAVIVAAVFPVYFASVAASELEPQEATEVFAWVTTGSLGLSALIAPILGRLADLRRWKKPLLAAFVALGATACAGMFWIGDGDLGLASVLFLLANLGAVGSLVFYDALLPHVAAPEEMDALSTSGYALGYLGGGLCLGVAVLLIRNPEMLGSVSDPTLPARLSFPCVGLWWVLFTLPLMRRVPEPPAARATIVRGAGLLRSALRETKEGLRSLLGLRQASLMLLAFLLYNDGVVTFIRMAGPFGNEIGLDHGHLIAAFLIVQFVGIPCTLAFGSLARRFGARPMVLAGLVVYSGTCLLAWKMDSEAEFYALAISVGAVMGGVQALSRSIFASLIPRERSGEFFSLYAVLDRFAGISGPALFGLTTRLTGSSRYSIFPLLALFIAGAWVLTRVDLEKGREQAKS